MQLNPGEIKDRLLECTLKLRNQEPQTVNVFSLFTSVSTDRNGKTASHPAAWFIDQNGYIQCHAISKAHGVEFQITNKTLWPSKPEKGDAQP